LLITNHHSFGAQVDAITGRTFLGTVALQNDVNCDIGDISGGQFIGSQGITQLISGGTILGARFAINRDGIKKGR